MKPPHFETIFPPDKLYQGFMKPVLKDPFGRTVTYLRLSLTDRCDLRCFYCMSERMVFLPKKDLLSLEELGQICDAFIARGVRKIRLTGGEPLVRKGFMTLVEHLSQHLAKGNLDEICLTTNGTQLARHSQRLKSAGIERINVSLDSLDPHVFNRVTRGGNLTAVLEGIEAAQQAGLHIKINMVALKNANASEIPQMITFAHAQNMDISLIEIMPMGETGEDRFEQYIPLLEVRENLETRWTLRDIKDNTGGPSRYVRIEETGGRLGFISPLSHNFCATCNRVRVSCTGQLFMCLGRDDSADLRAVLRGANGRVNLDKALDEALDEAIGRKPERHDFAITAKNAKPALARHMSLTGG